MYLLYVCMYDNIYVLHVYMYCSYCMTICTYVCIYDICMYVCQLVLSRYTNRYVNVCILFATIRSPGSSGSVEKDLFREVLLTEAAIKAVVSKYASNQPAFVKEVAEVYQQLTLLGEAYTTRNS